MVVCTSARACASSLVEKPEKKVSRGGEKQVGLWEGQTLLRPKERHLNFNAYCICLIDKQMAPGLGFSEYQILWRERALIKAIFHYICGLVALQFLSNALMSRRLFKTSKSFGVQDSKVFWGGISLLENILHCKYCICFARFFF